MSTGLILFFAVGFIGMIAHQLKKWARDNHEESLKDFLLAHPKYTLAALATYVGAVVGLLQIVNGDYDSTQSLAMSFMAGYTSDSAVNRSPSTGDYGRTQRYPRPHYPNHHGDYNE